MRTLKKREAMLLRALLAGESYGLEVMERLRRDTRSIRIGQWVYPTLHRFEREGFVTRQEGKIRAERGNRPRIYYKLTPSGRKALRAYFNSLPLPFERGEQWI